MERQYRADEVLQEAVLLVQDLHSRYTHYSFRDLRDDPPVGSKKFTWEMTREELNTPPKNHWQSLPSGIDTIRPVTELTLILREYLTHIAQYRPNSVPEAVSALECIQENLRVIREAIERVFQNGKPLPAGATDVRKIQNHPLSARNTAAAAAVATASGMSASPLYYQEHLFRKYTGKVFELHQSQTPFTAAGEYVWREGHSTIGKTRKRTFLLMEIAGYTDKGVPEAMAADLLKSTGIDHANPPGPDRYCKTTLRWLDDDEE